MQQSVPCDREVDGPSSVDGLAREVQTPPHTMQQSMLVVSEAGDLSKFSCSDGMALVVQTPSHIMEQPASWRSAVVASRAQMPSHIT